MTLVEIIHTGTGVMAWREDRKPLTDQDRKVARLLAVMYGWIQIGDFPVFYQALSDYEAVLKREISECRDGRRTSKLADQMTLIRKTKHFVACQTVNSEPF